uniref:C-JID domain-containing protein n=1 Tax=Quercus lobata TaxID=97700 RepID=A0A7N2MGF2_QUELO
MSSLKSLEKLVLSGCLQLANLPENIWEINFLKELDLSRTGIRQPFERNFSALSWLFSQKQLNLSRFYVLEGIRLNIGLVSPSSLKYLTLSWNKFITLPATINQLSKLETLDLCQCDQLRELPELPSTGLLCRKTEYETYTKRKEDRSRTEFQLIIPGSKIPQWLTHRSVENSISIVLPPNWCNSRWMGFALCACLYASYMPTTVEVFGKTSGLGARVMALVGCSY